MIPRNLNLCTGRKMVCWEVLAVDLLMSLPEGRCVVPSLTAEMLRVAVHGTWETNIPWK